MTTEIYNKRLIVYAEEWLSTKFNLTEIEKLFLGKSQKFNLFNFFLLCKCIESDEEFNFQILIPDKYYKEYLLSTLLLSLSIIKYKQNISIPHNSKLYSEPSKNDVYYTSNRICQVERIADEQCVLTYKNPSNSEIDTEILESKNKLSSTHKLRKEFTYNRNTLKYLQEYIKFYKTYIDGYKFLTSFQQKTVIISSSSILSQEQKLFLPFVYQGEKADSIPVTPLIQVFNKYEEARNYLKANNDIQEVIVIGYEKYQKLFGQILNDKNSGLFNKLILIGSKKVKDSSFKFWQWTQKEINSLL
ncbi:MAG: hypothetical protein AAFO82_15560, partial [Bacteroidota bacterium]